MGIRVKKVLGYGLFDVKFNSNEIIDKRFNTDINNIISNIHKNKHISYLEYLKEHLSKIDYMLADKRVDNWTCNNFITCTDKEFDEDTNIFMITHCSNWFRYDDIIDYTVESELYSQKSHVEIIKNGIFPYSGSYMIKGTGKKLTYLQREMVSMYKQLPSKTTDTRSYGQKIKKELNLKFVDDIYTEIIPIIPKEIQLFCKWLNIFSDEKYIYHLKPMCYTYWS